MRIAGVDCWLLDIPLRGAFRGAHGTRSAQPGVAVRIRTDAGPAGAGNVDPSPGYSRQTPGEVADTVQRVLGPALLGRDARAVRGLLAAMDAAAPGACEPIAALEMALLDLNGKALGVPAHRLLGGAVRQQVELNGWVGILPPEEAAAEARRFAEMGFRSLKVKVGEGLAPDAERVAAVRAAVPQTAIRVDGNEGFDVDTAIALARAIARHGIALYEQPVPRDDLEGMVRIRKAIDIPLMADEAVYDPGTLMAVIKREAADIVKVKVMKQGGLLRTLQAIDLCKAAGIPCVLGHGFGLTLHTLAELHVAAAADNLLDACEAVGPLKVAGDIVAEPLAISGGALPVPAAPGLGAALDEARLERYVARAA